MEDSDFEMDEEMTGDGDDYKLRMPAEPLPTFLDRSSSYDLLTSPKGLEAFPPAVSGPSNYISAPSLFPMPAPFKVSTGRPSRLRSRNLFVQMKMVVEGLSYDIFFVKWDNHSFFTRVQLRNSDIPPCLRPMPYWIVSVAEVMWSHGQANEGFAG